MGSSAAAQLRQQLYRELWFSFAALIRSYAAALAMAIPGGEFQVAERADGALELQSGSKVLAFHFDALSCAGTWQISRRDAEALTSGKFRMDEDGRISLDGCAPVEMDAAAEMLTAKLL